MPGIFAMLGRMARFRPHSFVLLLLALSVLGAFHVMLREVNYGVALSWDSINYIVVARNLLAGEGFTQLSGAIHTKWAPLYSALLAGTSLHLFDPHDVAGPVNAVIFGLTILVAGQWLRQRLESPFLTVWSCFAIAFAVPLAGMASWAMSESAFILLATLALIHADKFLTGSKGSSLIWAAVFTALALLTRYIGVAVAVTVVLLLVLQPGDGLVGKAKRIAGYLAIALLPLSLWLLRNFLATGRLTGNRHPVDYHLPEILYDTLTVISRWALPGRLAGDYQPIVMAVTVIALAALVVVPGYFVIRAFPEKDKLARWLPFYAFASFAAVYGGLYLFALMLGNTLHGVQARHLVPLYLPIMLSTVFAIDRLLTCARDWEPPATARALPVFRTINPAGGALRIILTIMLCLWLVCQVAWNAAEIYWANTVGTGHFNNATWAKSQVLQYIKENPIAGDIFSNAPPLVYIHTDGAAKYHYLPQNRPVGHVVSERDYTNQEMLSRLLRRDVDSAHVVWLYDVPGSHLYEYNAVDLRLLPGVKVVAELYDGAIFHATLGGVFDAEQHRSGKERYLNQLLAASGQPVSRSHFDLYTEGRKLTYFRQPCSEGDTAPRFFLHIIPDDINDLPGSRQRHGFDNLDFDFRRHGVRVAGKCATTVRLPEYSIASIRTGQFVGDEGEIWKTKWNFGR